MEKHWFLRLLMILCYAFRQGSSMAILWEGLTQIDADTYNQQWMEPGESWKKGTVWGGVRKGVGGWTGGRMQGKNTGRDNWTVKGASLGWARNLGPWKSSGIQRWPYLRLLVLGDMEPEISISCNQRRLPIESWLRHQLSHKILDPQFSCQQNLQE